MIRTKDLKEPKYFWKYRPNRVTGDRYSHPEIVVCRHSPFKYENKRALPSTGSEVFSVQWQKTNGKNELYAARITEMPIDCYCIESIKLAQKIISDKEYRYGNTLKYIIRKLNKMGIKRYVYSDCYFVPRRYKNNAEEYKKAFEVTSD